MEMKKSIYSKVKDPKKYFCEDTRNCIRLLIRTFSEAEISKDLIRQRIKHKMRIKEDAAFAALDFDQKGYLVLNDFRRILDLHSLVYVERNLGLLFKSFDRSDSYTISFEDFVQGVQPFLAT